MTPPLVYYVRHGETDWNVEARLQGAQDIPLNAAGRAQATWCGRILGDLAAIDGRAIDALDFISSPLGRARHTMELMREALGVDPRTYRIDPRLTEVSFGSWEGLTLAEVGARDRDAVAARERDKWNYVPAGGESYATMSRRLQDWYASLTRDAVVVAHGGTLRGLMVQLGIATPDVAPHLDIRQGVVYRIADGAMAVYA
jgi:broad specificity phosphatase PhoE